MISKPKIAFSFLVIFFFMLSCQKETDDSKGGTPPPSSELWGNSVNISINGRVLDQNGDPVSAAQVSAGNSNTTTDAMGVFRLTNVSAYQRLAYVKVEKAGYFPGSRSFVPGNSAEVVELELLPKTVAGTVPATSGGIVNAQGVSIALPANGVVKSDNTPHTGNVKVSLAYIDPTGADFTREMPGNLLGVQNNQAQGLTSYGMVAVELTTSGGLPLQLAQGQTAEVRFPIPATQQASAPATIDLWSFDEVNGYWRHEGQATKTGTEYVAQVSHFSFWNCDMSWTYVVLDGLVKDAGNQPVQGALVTISGSNVGSASDITNSQGAFGGYVPANTPLSISVAIDCGGSSNTVYTANIGPFTANTTLNPITINPQNITTVTGTVVDCNSAALANSYVVANGQVVFAPNGQFSFQTCGSSVSITPYGISPWVAGTAQNVSLSGGSVSAGNLQACSGGGGTGSVTDIDGNTYNTVIIGTQEWMGENLKVSKYRNGDPIPTNLSDFQWTYTTAGAYDVYPFDSTNNMIYGKLYNWYAVVDSRELCPASWHVPNDAEWTLLENFLGGSFVAGGKMKAVSSLWYSPNTGATNSSGFTGLPGGFRDYTGGFYSLRSNGIWWSSTLYSTSAAWSYVLSNDSANIVHVDRGKMYGFSVRCVRD